MRARLLPLPLAALVAASLIPLAAPPPARADWSHNPTANVPVCIVAGSQSSQRAVSDGAGGIIVVWEDGRSGNSDIYAQRLDSTGTARWPAGGVAVCTQPAFQSGTCITSDGAGGVIVAWQDDRGTPIDKCIYAQRVSAAGTAMWTANGVPLNIYVIGNHTAPAICSDGAGGAIVAWNDQRVGPNTGVGDIYGQRINANGTLRWGPFGYSICYQPNDQSQISMAPDGFGGALLAWTDRRVDGFGDLYSQRVDSLGTPRWTVDGVPVNTVAGPQSFPVVESDGTGGALIAFQTWNGVDDDLSAGHVGPFGDLLSGYGTATLCALAGNQSTASVASDGAGGMIVAWTDQRGGAVNIYAQRFGASSTGLWAVNGVPICTATNNQNLPSVVPDGNGGAVIAWVDWRSGLGDIYAQSVSASGATRWATNGVAMCSASTHQNIVRAVPDGRGGIVGAWLDTRNGENDLYAQGMDLNGVLGDGRPRISGVHDAPSDQGGFIDLSWSASWVDAQPYMGVSEYRLWHSVPVTPVPDQARVERTFTSDPDEAAATGALWVSAAQASGYAWEYMQSVTPTQSAFYSQRVTSWGDSIPGSDPSTAFMVEARGTFLPTRWFSLPDSGHSVDNLAPPKPAPFTASYLSGHTLLSWGANSAPDLAGYRLYRGVDGAFALDAAHLVIATTGISRDDVTGTQWVYKLVAVDIHGNASLAAIVIPPSLAGVDGAIGALAFASPTPNPAQRAASVRWSLPREGRVRLALHDLAGREVRLLRNGTFAAGDHTEALELRDGLGRDLAPGVYLLRFEAESRSITRRLVVVR